MREEEWRHLPLQVGDRVMVPERGIKEFFSSKYPVGTVVESSGYGGSGSKVLVNLDSGRSGWYNMPDCIRVSDTFEG